ncbi:MAG: hypothetical protein K6E30_04965 [Lachnospiraceae bacterium]|nr:hypothetical protein [Lachnospiraceae bacterium]
MAELFMITDFTNPYEYVGSVDYVFVGTVTGTERLVLPDKAKEHQDITAPTKSMSMKT